MSGFVLLLLRILLSGTLFVFLGWAIYTLWASLRQEALAVSHQKIPALTLNSTDELAEEYYYIQPVINVGRGTTNDLVINNDTVSNHHARLAYNLNQWWLQDLNSTNGTYINGQRLLTSTVLTTGDLIGFGEVNLTITIGNNAQFGA
ncbi:MAG TPA: FHA domain-containing protein [Anaerolineales bacterium]|nr:FHA domain-containing protein [Anaerolineales bacterium]